MDDEKKNEHITGQIDISEMLVREDESLQKKEDLPPKAIDGQMQFDFEGAKNMDEKIDKPSGNAEQSVEKNHKSRVVGENSENTQIATERSEEDFESNNHSKKFAKQREFFVEEETNGLHSELNDINKDFEEVDKDVGTDVFANYASAKSNVDIEEKIYAENSGEKIGDGLLYKNLDTVLHESMIPYSEHVILDRALPRVEDGLKPVQRRILFSMFELGVTPDKPFRKSAKIVGDCLGKYHPHGDSSVYDAMVRMAQSFNTNELLVSGHGNFGSVDGDGPAAMRYTEARLSPLAMELLRDLDKNTVKWGLNFDDTLKEPEILPGRFPNLLVNGTSGIAVGLATNIPPHNLAETIDGVVAYIDNPKISLDEMMKIIKGPDFPTGAYVLSNSELRQAYETGRGKIYLRAKMHIETDPADRKSIVITELPYQVNKSALLQKIAGFKDEDKFDLGDVAEIRDESDREGTRAVIRLKKDASLNKIYKSLLKNTELQGTFGINMVAIAGGKPKQMGLLDIISYYSEYQREVVLRRSKYDLEQAQEREHILLGLIVAITNIDAVVKIIKTSANTTEAKKRLRDRFLLSEKQAQAILDMRLARLTSLEVNKLQDELKMLAEKIKQLSSIVASTKKQFEIVKEELLQIKKEYGRERQTKFLKEDEKLPTEEEQNDKDGKDVVVVLSATDCIKCISTRAYSMAQKEFKESSSLTEVHPIKIQSQTTSYCFAFTNLGNCHKAVVKTIGNHRYKDKGAPTYSVFKDLEKHEKIVALFDEKQINSKHNLIFFTKNGMIKKSPAKEYNLTKKSFQAIKFKDEDILLRVVLEPELPHTAVFVSSAGMILNAKVQDVPCQGRVSVGVKGIALAEKDFCVGANVCENEEGEVLCVTNKGFAKRVVLAKVDESLRNRKGLKMLVGGESGKCFAFADVVRAEKTLCVEDVDKNLFFKSTEQVLVAPRTDKGKVVAKGKRSVDVQNVWLAHV